MVKFIGKRLLLLTVAAVIFVISGYIGMMCETFHDNLAVSTTAFGISVASITAGFLKIYHFFIG